MVAPTCGYFADQWQDVVSYTHDEAVGLDTGSLTEAVTAALNTPAPPATCRPDRRAQLADVQVLHAELYRRDRRR